MGGDKDEDGNGHKDRNGRGNRSMNGDRNNRRQGGGGREPGNLRRDIRGGVQDVSVRGGATPTSDQETQPQDSTPQQDRRIMRRTRAQGREAGDRTGEGGGEKNKRKKPQKSYRRDVGKGADSGGRQNTYTREVWLSRCRPRIFREYVGRREGSARRSRLK